MNDDLLLPNRPNRIRIKLESAAGKVRLADLMVFLERLSGALGTVDRAVNGRSSNYFNVADLAYGSAVIELEERIQESKRLKRHVVRSAVESMDELLRSAEQVTRPFWANGEVLNKVRLLSDPLPHGSLARLATKDFRVSLDDGFRAKVDELLSPDTSTEGQLVGRLDAINMHGRRHAYLYPLYGHQKVVCDFAAQNDEMVIGALQKRVRVYGEVKRHSGDPFPYHVIARSFEILPPNEDLPTLRSLRGVYVPTFEGTSTEFQRKLRDGGAA